MQIFTPVFVLIDDTEDQRLFKHWQFLHHSLKFVPWQQSLQHVQTFVVKMQKCTPELQSRY